MATFRKRGDRWEVQVRLKLLTRPVSKTFATREAAEKWAKQFEKFRATEKVNPRRHPGQGKQWLDAEDKPSYELIRDQVQDTPCFSGIYFLFYGDEVVYVGQSRHVTQRVFTHTADKNFDGYAVMRCNISRLDEVEEHYIKLLGPKYNKVKLDPATSKKRQKAELDKLLEENGYPPTRD